MIRGLAVAAVALAAAPAAADPAARLDLRVRPRVRLAMRAAPPTAPAAAPAAAPGAAALARPAPDPLADLDAALGTVRVTRRAPGDPTPPLADRLIVRVDLGLAVDGASASGQRSLSGQALAVGSPTGGAYNQVRGYGFGEVYLGSRGIGAASLSTYVASQLRAATESADLQPLLSPYDRAFDLQARSGWVEVDGAFTHPLLAPLRVRAGRQFLYGPAIVHADALHVAYARGGVAASVWGGSRVRDFDVLGGEDDELGRGDPVSGADVRVDLRRWKVPLAAGASVLSHRDHQHSDLTATLIPHRDVVVRSSTRLRDAVLARQRVVVRARITQDSTAILDTQVRTRQDWMWDYSGLTVDPSRGVEVDLAARRYLDLGPVQPRFTSSLQAGTVLLENIDLLVRGAVAVDLDADEDADARTPHLAPYVEVGGGIEVRLRRALAVQATGLARDYARPDPGRLVDARTPDPQPLPARGRLGEEALLEGGIAVRFTTGARQLSAHGEVYARQTSWATVYRDEANEPVDGVTRHGGGRFWVDAWVNPRVRVRTEYDLSTALEVSPEIRGVKMLRLLVEGTY